jgi:general secretion pathway protein A
MYTEYYGFSDNPFNITPDPRFLYLTPGHREALAALIYGIKERKGFVALTGEVGTGKTTLLYRLIDNLNEKVRTAFIFHTHTTFKQVLKSIFLELNLPVRDDDTVLLISRLNHYLIERAVAGEIVALIIDEAQDLSEEVLEDIRLLSNLETRSAKLLQIVLCGQPELEEKLNATGLRQLRQRIAILRRIGPLSDAECWDYVDHRLKIVGGNAARLFTPGAMTLLCRHSRRIPRVINVMCDNALLIGFAKSSKKIDETIMLEVIRDMDGALSHATPLTVTLSPATPALPVIEAAHKPPPHSRKLNSLQRLLASVSARRR